MITIQCPRCEHKMNTEVVVAGQPINCLNCNRQFACGRLGDQPVTVPWPLDDTMNMFLFKDFNVHADGVVECFCPKCLADKARAEAKAAPNLLRAGAKTYEERNKLYGDSYKNYGQILAILFPSGLSLKTAEDHNRMGVLTMIISKITRYSANLTRGGHQDSAHDMMVYAAMLEELTEELSNAS